MFTLSVLHLQYQTAGGGGVVVEHCGPFLCSLGDVFCVLYG